MEGGMEESGTQWEDPGQWSRRKRESILVKIAQQTGLEEMDLFLSELPGIITWVSSFICFLSFFPAPFQGLHRSRLSVLVIIIRLLRHVLSRR